jgi:hypothetical protein
LEVHLECYLQPPTGEFEVQRCSQGSLSTRHCPQR